MTIKNPLFCFITTAMLFIASNSAIACTRAVYLGPDNMVIAARSLDWDAPFGTNLWVFPRGMTRDSAVNKDALTWTAKYGSVISSGFDAFSVDGMNEKGLVMNLLYLAESQYPKPGSIKNSKPMSIGVWGQYVLDNFATVAEAVAELQKETFYVVPVMTPDGRPGQGHLSISDQTGDSAIFEYIDGKLVIHQGKQYQVMTNSPTFDKQLALDGYWEDIGGAVMLPGTGRAADRFVRATYYESIAPQTNDLIQALASSFAVIRNASVPFGVVEAGKPNIAATLWRTVSDQKNLNYYFESTTTPNVFWTEFKDLNFAADQKVKKLTISNGEIYAGNVAKQYVDTPIFKFLAAKI